jgi:hypothetical protein
MAEDTSSGSLDSAPIFIVLKAMSTRSARDDRALDSDNANDFGRHVQSDE